MQTKRKTSIATRLIGYIVPANILVALGFSFFYLYQDYQEKKKEINETIKKIEKQSLPSLARSLFDEDDDQIKASLKGIMGNRDIVYLELTRVYEGIADKKPEHKLGVFQKDNVLVSKVDIIYTTDETSSQVLFTGSKKGTVVGKLTLVASLSGILQFIKTQLQFVTFIQILQFIIVTVIIYTLFNRLVSRHLASMSRYAEALDLENIPKEVLKLERKDQLKSDELEDMLNSFNKMKNNLRESHLQLKDYAQNLETKVTIATAEFFEEKNKTESLLNNMKQAIFAVNQNGEVIAPVSHFTKDVFGEDVTGKDIFQTLYKDLDRKSEAYSNIQSVFAMIFGKDKIQFEITDYFLPKKIIYRAFNAARDKYENKILRVSNGALWDDQGFLINLLYVIEDTTETEKLTSELQIKAEKNEKNISLITEMVHLESDEVSSFIKGSMNLIQNSIKLKKIRALSEKEKEEVFRYLHTLKGNARAYNFYYLSNLVHLAEGKWKEISGKEESTRPDDHLSLEEEDFIESLYLIVQEINDYSNIAEKIFRLKNILDDNSSDVVTEKITEMENIIERSFSCPPHLLSSQKTMKSKRKLFEEIKRHRPDKEMIERLILNSELIKTYFNSHSSLKENIEPIFLFEKTLRSPNVLELKDLEFFSKSFIDNFLNIKTSAAQFLKEKKLGDLEPYDLDEWLPIFRNLFKITIILKSDIPQPDNKEVMNLINLFVSDSESVKNHLFVKLGNDLTKTLNKVEAEKPFKPNFDYILSHLWSFFALISKLENSPLGGRDQEVLIETFIKIERASKLDPLSANKYIEDLVPSLKNSFIFRILKMAVEENQSLTLFFELVKQLIPGSTDNLFKAFFFPLGSRPNIGKVLDELDKRNFADAPGEELITLMSQGDPLADFLHTIFADLPYYNYLQYFQTYSFLKSFKQRERVDEQSYLKSKTFPVVTRNIEGLESLMKDIGLSPTKNDLKKIQNAIQKLRHLPIVPSLNKLKSMVNEISDRIGKSVDLKIDVPDITMDKENFQKLQEAIIQLLRNAVDHGIESPQDRIDVGKTARGVIEIKCSENKDGSLTFMIKDDGQGLNPEKVVDKAISNGLVSREKIKKMQLKEKLDLIFLSSFSLKATPDEISGQGFGLDIVKKNIEAIGGTITVESSLKKGTQFIIAIK